jgi:hypothetical protein
LLHCIAAWLFLGKTVFLQGSGFEVAAWRTRAQSIFVSFIEVVVQAMRCFTFAASGLGTVSLLKLAQQFDLPNLCCDKKLLKRS